MRRALFALGLLVACNSDEPSKPTSSSSSPSTTGSAPSTTASRDPNAMPASWAKLLGDKPATFGPTLSTLRFGATIDDASLPDVPDTSWRRRGDQVRTIHLEPDGTEPRASVNLEIYAGLFAIEIELYTNRGSIPEDSCAAFVTALAKKWGASTERIWIDREHHVRASFQDTCRLRFERYVDVASWIGPDPASIVPVAFIGKPAKDLAPRVGDVFLDAGVTYRAEGIGEHVTGPTRIYTYTKKAITVGMTAEAYTSAADRAAIRERISSAFNAQPKRDPKTGYDVWPSKPPIRMLEIDDGVRIEVGDLTP